MTTPWGTGSWGTGAYGGPGPSVSVANAFAAGSNLVRVTLNGVAMQVDAITAGDALNPNSWSVTRDDTDESLVVIAVSMVQQGTVYDLALLHPLGDAFTDHTLDARNLKSSSGVPCFPPQTFTFHGALASRQPQQEPGPTWMRPQTQDLRNDIAPTQPRQIPATLVIGPNRDYVNVSGTELVQKMILRRYTTVPGGFFWLPNFGAGLRPKDILRTPDLPTLQKKLRDQALMEPDVASADVRLVIDRAQQIVYAVTKAVSTTGEAIQSVQTPLGSSTALVNL